MTQAFNHNTVQSALGYYFKAPSLLAEAFTHVSFSNTENNEALVFLGKRLIDFIISDYVCSHYTFSTEKQLIARLDEFKKALPLQKFISDKKLSGHIRLSSACETMRESKTLHGEIFLALSAAIYRDGGLPSFKAFILPLVRAVDSDGRYAPKNEPALSVGTAKKEHALGIGTSKNEYATAISQKDSQRKEKLSVFDTHGAENRNATKKNGIEDGAKAVKPQNNSKTKKAEEEKPPKAKKDGKTEKIASEKETEIKEKKGVNLFKAIIMPAKARKKDPKTLNADITNAVPKATERAETAPKTEAEVKEVRRSFIRDALAPVSLPESMRNPKPRKPIKATSETRSDATEESKYDATERNRSDLNPSDDTENYKSLLQEYVQKNIHSASVLIKYTTERVGKTFKTELSLEGKVLARAEAAVKKSAEKEAARLAYAQLTDGKSSLSSWFTSISSETPERAPDNYVSRLNEYYQKKSHSSAAPLTYESRPSGERKLFSVAIVFNGEELSLGNGHTVKDARQDAAKKACEKLNIK